MVGDFNEAWEDSLWLFSITFTPVRDEVTSRWQGKEILDFGMADEQLGASCWFHSAFFSDHKLVHKIWVARLV